MIDDIAGYRFEDLVDAGILKSRTDLARKQKEAGFPMPVKLGKRQAWFPKAEVQVWLNKRIAERPAATFETELATPQPSAKMAPLPPRVDAPVPMPRAKPIAAGGKR